MVHEELFRPHDVEPERQHPVTLKAELRRDGRDRVSRRYLLVHQLERRALADEVWLQRKTLERPGCAGEVQRSVAGRRLKDPQDQKVVSHQPVASLQESLDLPDRDHKRRIQRQTATRESVDGIAVGYPFDLRIVQVEYRSGRNRPILVAIEVDGALRFERALTDDHRRVSSRIEALAGAREIAKLPRVPRRRQIGIDDDGDVTT